MVQPEASAIKGKKAPLGEMLTTVGALFSAVLSSACCWLPLLLIGFGLSAGGVASAFEAYRPALLAVTGLFLAVGFYLAYLRNEKCEPDSACATPNRKLLLFNKISLWAATVVVAGFAFFPNYVGAFLSDGGDAAPPPATSEALRVVKVDIEGMTCEACSVNLTAALKRVEGTRQVAVSFEEKLATVHVVAGTEQATLIQAIEATGDKGKVRSSDPIVVAGQSQTLFVEIEGMTCEACAVGIAAELKKVLGASRVRVSSSA
ncbi:MAG: cation transporter [Planctomycetes bacterium]|nr:cation transporter [Planctomycetota bacterium]